MRRDILRLPEVCGSLRYPYSKEQRIFVKNHNLQTDSGETIIRPCNYLALDFKSRMQQSNQEHRETHAKTQSSDIGGEPQLILTVRSCCWIAPCSRLAVVAVLLASVIAGMPRAALSQQPSETSADQLRREFYSYDNTLPLNAVLKPLQTTTYSARYHLAYDSANDQRVTAILSLPRQFQGKHPAVLLMHGSGGHKDVDYIQAAAGLLNSRGYTTISIDSQYKGERVRPGKTGELQPDSYTTRDAWIQTVIDLRRAIDFLQTRSDVDPTKIGYLGVSMGGMLGAVLGGVESRISCFFLAVPGGGLVNVAKHIDQYPNLKARFAVAITPEVFHRIEAIADVIDPIYFVGGILPRPLMITVGIHDELIPAEMSTALVEASHASQDQVKRVNSGHIPPPGVIALDIVTFFSEHLGKQQRISADAPKQ